MFKSFSIILLQFSFFLFTYNNSYSQAHWDTLAQFDAGIEDLEVFDGKLFITGGFFNVDGQSSWGSAYFDGNDIVRQTNTYTGSGIRNMALYNNELYSESGIFYSSSIGVSKWDGTKWIDGGGSNYGASAICAHNNYLYVAQQDGVFRRIDANGSSETLFTFGNIDIFCMASYDGKLVLGGDFDEIEGVQAKNIISWDGSNWQPLGDGVNNDVFTFEVDDNILYAGGRFSLAEGDSVFGVAKWNGTDWQSIDGINTNGSKWNRIQEIKVFGNNVLVSGKIIKLNGQEGHDLFLWNGSTWNTLNLDSLDLGIAAIEVYDNHLYVGSFNWTDSYLLRLDSVFNDPNSTSIATDLELEFVRVYPNPTSNLLSIDFGQIESGALAEVYSINGSLIEHFFVKSASESLNVKNYANGVYMIKVNDQGKTITRTKFVVSH